MLWRESLLKKKRFAVSELKHAKALPWCSNGFFSSKIQCCLSVSRSTDYGSTYTKLNDKVGSRTVLSYLYVCPTNKQKVSISLWLLSLSVLVQAQS